jgi:hypothetical protein
MMKLLDYLTLLEDSELKMANAFELLATRHSADGDVRHVAKRMATWSLEKRAALRPAIARYGQARSSDIDRLYDVLFRPRPGGYGLVRDIHDASILVHHVYLSWTALDQAAQALQDTELTELCKLELERTEKQARWLRTVFKTSAPQALTIVPEKISELKATLQSMLPRLAVPAAALGAFAAVTAIAALARRSSR